MTSLDIWHSQEVRVIVDSSGAVSDNGAASTVNVIREIAEAATDLELLTDRLRQSIARFRI